MDFKVLFLPIPFHELRTQLSTPSSSDFRAQSLTTSSAAEGNTDLNITPATSSSLVGKIDSSLMLPDPFDDHTQFYGTLICQTSMNSELMP